MLDEIVEEEKAEEYTQKHLPTVIIGSPFDTLKYYQKSDIQLVSVVGNGV